jgi:ATP-dependent DNA helicase RecQ
MSATADTLRQLLRERFGHEEFRPGQERVIRALLTGRDVLAVLPTGAGKSLVYQVASQVLPGVTLVVSPLLALMKDQVDTLAEAGVLVEQVSSAQSESASEEALERVVEGETKLLYVTPERLRNEEFLDSLTGREVSLLVVDEAHCVSEWGFDFRPAYLGLGSAAERLGRPTLLSLTATATPWVRRDIVERLGMREPEVVVRGVDRPNLFLEVVSASDEEDEVRVLQRLLMEAASDYSGELVGPLTDAMQGSGIVYTSTTRGAEETAEWLRRWGISADHYHGQRRKADRERVQEAFMGGEVRVIAATNAFGMGVDKPDVRFVIHRDIPASVEAYYQEAGRAGRDGELARCTLIYRPADVGRAAFRSGGGRVSLKDVEQTRKALVSRPEATLPELKSVAGVSQAKVSRVLGLLTRQGVVEEVEGRFRLLQPEFAPADVSLESEEARRAYEKSRLQMMRGYAELWECRRRYLLNYFGEEMETPACAMCDLDTRATAPTETGDGSAEFQPGDRVRHSEWGEGAVTETDDDTLTVSFAGAGEKTLARSVVEDRGLLEMVARGDGARPRGAGADGNSALAVGTRVVHPEFGTGEISRVSDVSVTVLFDGSGYRTLDLAAVHAGELRPKLESSIA